MEQVNCLEETTEFENSLWCGSNLQGVDISEKNFKAISERSQPTGTKDDAEAWKDFWSIEGDFNYRHYMLNLDFKTTCGKNKHFQFHWIAFMWPGLLTKIWMCCKKPVLTIIGNVDVDRSLSDSWTRLTNCKQKNFFQDICVPGSAVRRSKQLPDLIICGLKFGPPCPKQRRRRKRKNGQWRSQSSITLEDWEAFFLEKPKVDNARRLRGICFIDPGRRRERSPQKREEKVGDSYGGGNALQNGEQRSA